MNVYKTLATLGVPPAFIPMAGQYLYYLPQTCDPDVSGTQVIIRALQTGLRRLGHSAIRVNGVFDEATVRAIDSVAPPAGSWQVKTWLQLLGAVADAIRNPASAQVKLRALSGYHASGDIWDDLKNIGPASSFLKWGYGVTSSSNCAPADSATKTVFIALQRQANRLGAGLVEDGVLGKATVSALQRLSSVTGVNPASCADVAGNAILIGTRLKAEADRQGVGATAGKPPPAPSSSERPGGQIYQSKEQLTGDAKDKLGIGIIEQLKPYAIYAFIAAGAAWFVFKRKKGGGKAIFA